jgi:hypothetical protein
MRLLAGLEMNSLQVPAERFTAVCGMTNPVETPVTILMRSGISRRPFSFSQYEKFSGLGHASHLNMRYSLSH